MHLVGAHHDLLMMCYVNSNRLLGMFEVLRMIPRILIASVVRLHTQESYQWLVIFFLNQLWPKFQPGIKRENKFNVSFDANNLNAYFEILIQWQQSDDVPSPRRSISD